MKASDLVNGKHLKPWKPQIDLVPHVTIETNMNCNFKCKACYNINTSFIKTKEQIFEEIDLSLTKRKVDTISLIGGEPTLHPDLSDIIIYIKTKNVVCQLLTNGFLLYKDHENILLKKLKDAGLDRIILHIDKGQEEYPNPNAAIHKIMDKCDRYKIAVTLSWTIYKEYQGLIPELIQKFSAYKYFDGLLTLLEKPVDDSIKSDYKAQSSPKMEEEYNAIYNRLNLEPAMYLPTSLDDNEISWLLYLYYINSETQRTFNISPALTRFMKKLYLKRHKQEMFGKLPTRSTFYISFLVAGLIETILSPSKITDFIKILKSSMGKKVIRFHYLVIQDGPKFIAGQNKVAICYHCPDATIRNGKITPVCLADRINPFDENNTDNSANIKVRNTVYEHLNEV